MAEPVAPLQPTPAPEPPQPPAAQLRVYDPSGQIVSIDAGDLPAARDQGFVLANQTPDAPLYDTIKAGARGALRGATAGLQENFEAKARDLIGPIIGMPKDWGKQYGEESHRLEQEHPTASVVGEGVGMVGGTLVGEGALLQGGKLATGVGRGLTAIGRTGELAGSLATKATAGLAKAGTLGRAAAAGLELGARGAVETGLYSAVDELHEEMLGDAPLNAEKIYAAAAEGAKGGAVLGGGLGAAGSLGKSAVKGLASIATDVIAKNADTLESFANDQRWRSLDPLKKYTKEAEKRVPGGHEAVGEVLGRYGVTGNTLEEAARSGDIASISGRIDTAVEEVGAKLGELHAGSTAVIPWGTIDDALEKTIAPLRNKALHEGIVASLEDAKASIASHLVPEAAAITNPLEKAAWTAEQGMTSLREAPVSIQDAMTQRKALDQIAYRESKALDPKLRVEFLRDMRKNFEGVIVDAFGDAATAAGNPGAKAELLALKRDYQALSLAQDAANDSTARMATNRNLSLTDYISGGIGSHIGGAIGSVAGPVGAGLGSLAGGAVGSAVNRFGRDRGNAIAAAVLDKAAEFARAKQAIKLVDTHIEKAAAGLLEGAKKPTRVASNMSPYRTAATAASATEAKDSLRTRYEKAREELAHIQSDPNHLAARAAIPAAFLPKTSDALTATALRAAGYMASQTPPSVGQPALGMPLPTMATDADMHAFLEKFDVAQNPMTVLRDFARGTITQNKAEALRVVAPELFKQLQIEALQLVADKQARGKALNFETRQRMSLLLDIQTDPSQATSMARSLQSNLAGAAQQGTGGVQGMGPKMSPGKPVQLPASMSSSRYDQLEKR